MASGLGNPPDARSESTVKSFLGALSDVEFRTPIAKKGPHQARSQDPALLDDGMSFLHDLQYRQC